MTSLAFSIAAFTTNELMLDMPARPAARVNKAWVSASTRAVIRGNDGVADMNIDLFCVPNWHTLSMSYIDSLHKQADMITVNYTSRD